jgi:Cys-tRNA(Pro)/Cys-tRNA(Cys) deacylase
LSFFLYIEAVKTNAARLLDSLSIPYELREYEVDPGDLAAETVARKIGLPPEQVFKTLVARGDRTGALFAVVPGDAELDLKALARLSGDRKVDTVPLKEVQPLTGYIRGGVTVLGAKKDYPAYVDETIELFDVISVSAGVRGTQILLSPADYLRAVRGIAGEIARPKE